MTRDEALKVLDTIPTIGEQVDALEMAIKALEQQPSEDCVSRQAVLEILAKHRCGYYSFDDYEILDKLMEEVSNLPSKGGDMN